MSPSPTPTAPKPTDAAPPVAGRRIVFLGGVLLDSQLGLIERNSRTSVQYAADTLQRALIKGLSLYTECDLHLVNVPFIGTYPKTYRAAWFPATTDLLFGRTPVSGMGFFNLLFARDVSRRSAAIRGMMPLFRGAEDAVILVYSAHLPFVSAALRCKRANPRLRICIIVPDLIEHMGDYRGWRKWLAQRRSEQFRRLVPAMDHLVVLTPPMADQLGVPAHKHLVIEGIHDPDPQSAEPVWSTEPGPIFIYTGSLEKRYGILDLLGAFDELDAPTARLWICGAGNAQAAVEDLARRDPRVTYFGRVPRTEALALQARAHVMVNPRRPEGEFTRYSFPSKTIEYLASGRPVVMHWLPGIPPEYRPHLITPETGDAAGLAAAMRTMAALPQAELERRGAAGRDFVLTHKTSRVQAGKVLAALFPGVIPPPAEGA